MDMGWRSPSAERTDPVRHVVVEVVGPLTLAIEQTKQDKSENEYRRFASDFDSRAPSYRLTLIGIGAIPQPVVLQGWPPHMVEIENIALGRAVGEFDGQPRGHHGTEAGKRVDLIGTTDTKQKRDARPRSLPKLSRERIALELWRSVTGYGERIAWPLVTASVAIVPLGIGHVGWAHFSRRAWWGGWSHLTSRLESLVNFALPGIDAIGLDGTTGIWGIAAKLCSVICLGAALNAARKLAVSG
jgi:hypothetical protein